MPTYRIRDWEKHFENSESKKYKSLTWVPIKNKHDGKGYRRVVARNDAAQVMCAWYLIVQVASKTPLRGVLADEDGPLTACDLHFKTGLPESMFELAFKVLSSKDIGWMEEVDSGKSSEISEDAGKSPKMPGETTVEQNRTEQNRSTLRELSPEPALPEIPNWQAVKAYSDRIGLAEWKAKDWFDEMEGCGWKDHQSRQVCRWQAVLNRVKTKWEADGRPTGPPKAQVNGSTVKSVFQLKTVLEAKQRLASDIKNRFATETGLTTEWSNADKRAEFIKLKSEIKAMEKQIAEAG